MRDQAEKLRMLARSIKQQVEDDINTQAQQAEAKVSAPQTRVIAVTSGKGGVGKTNFTINMALALAQKGQRVMILDADLGLANVDVVLGLNPQYTLYHVLKGETTIRNAVSISPQGIMVIAGGSGVQELANLPKKKLQKFIRQMEELEGMADILLIDTGAGLTKNVMSFVRAADEVVVICTPEPTAITDAYGMVKTLYHMKPQSMVHLVVNRVENQEEAEITANKLTTVAERFLQFPITRLGFILDDQVVSKSVKGQEPFILKYPNSLAAECIRGLAGQLLNEEEVPTASGGVRTFFKKMINFFS